MKNTIQYKGYTGSVEFSDEDAIFYGKVLGIRALISYEGENVSELLEDFHNAVDDYLDICSSEGIAPETAFAGSVHVHLSPELHKRIFLYAANHQMSMDQYIEQVLEKSAAAKELEEH